MFMCYMYVCWLVMLQCLFHVLLCTVCWVLPLAVGTASTLYCILGTTTCCGYHWHIVLYAGYCCHIVLYAATLYCMLGTATCPVNIADTSYCMLGTITYSMGTAGTLYCMLSMVNCSIRTSYRCWILLYVFFIPMLHYLSVLL